MTSVNYNLKYRKIIRLTKQVVKLNSNFEFSLVKHKPFDNAIYDCIITPDGKLLSYRVISTHEKAARFNQ